MSKANNQLDEQSSKNKNQRQETDKLFEECTRLFQTNDTWKDSVNKSVHEAMTKIHAQEYFIKSRFEKVVQMKDSVAEERNEIRSQFEVIIFSEKKIVIAAFCLLSHVSSFMVELPIR